MTTKSEAQPVAPPGTTPHATQEIPPLRRAPASERIRLTDNVVAAAHPPRPRPARRPRTVRHRLGLVGLLLVGLAVVLLQIGLTRGAGAASLWSAATLWSAFATASALLALLAFAAFFSARTRLRSEPAWRIAVGGLIGLAVFWLLVVLPEVATDRGFVLTAALASLGCALWIGPRKRG